MSDEPEIILDMRAVVQKCITAELDPNFILSLFRGVILEQYAAAGILEQIVPSPRAAAAVERMLAAIAESIDDDSHTKH